MRSKILLIALMLFSVEPQLAYADCPSGKLKCPLTHETFRYGKCFKLLKGCAAKHCNSNHYKIAKKKCASSQDGREWMKEIGDNTRLSQIAIPGTHDSGAVQKIPSFGIAQDINIKQQLELGIRFLDIRLSNGLVPGYFAVRHGDLIFGDFGKKVLRPVYAYLNAHPTETILMSIKREKPEVIKNADAGLNTAMLRKIVIQAPGSKFMTKVSDETTLGEARGKVVLINRIEDKHLTKSHGIAWSPIWAKSPIYNQRRIQDAYELEYDGFMSLDYNKKARKVLAKLDSAAENYNDGQFWISFASASKKSLSIRTTAEWVNPKVKKYFSDLTASKKSVGAIIPMDYPNRTPGVVGSIIRHSISQARASKGAPPPPAEQVACVSYGIGSRGIPTAGRCEVVAPALCIVPRGLAGGGKRAYPGKTCAKALELHSQQYNLVGPPATAPKIIEVTWSSHPAMPSGLKATCQAKKRGMCPVMKWEGHTYWAYSHRDNRYGMTIVAYDANGQIVKQWPKSGARYVSSISASDKTVTFTGQAGRTISMSLDELRVAHPGQQPPGPPAHLPVQLN